MSDQEWHLPCYVQKYCKYLQKDSLIAIDVPFRFFYVTPFGQCVYIWCLYLYSEQPFTGLFVLEEDIQTLIDGSPHKLTLFGDLQSLEKQIQIGDTRNPYGSQYFIHLYNKFIPLFYNSCFTFQQPLQTVFRPYIHTIENTLDIDTEQLSNEYQYISAFISILPSISFIHVGFYTEQIILLKGYQFWKFKLGCTLTLDSDNSMITCSSTENKFTCRFKANAYYIKFINLQQSQKSTSTRIGQVNHRKRAQKKTKTIYRKQSTSTVEKDHSFACFNKISFDLGKRVLRSKAVDI